MGEAWFYHLTRRPLEATLPMLLERSLARGWRVVVRGTDPGRMDWLDEKLWLEPKDGFLPHGRAGGPHDADQPVLLTTDAALADRADCLVAVDGAEVAPGELASLTRACILFDGNDDLAVQAARGQWRALVATGAHAVYWAEEAGTWQRKAESGG